MYFYFRASVERNIFLFQCVDVLLLFSTDRNEGSTKAASGQQLFWKYFEADKYRLYEAFNPRCATCQGHILPI
jgi:hypothetical protein